MWHSYHLSCSHLRPSPPLPPPRFYLAGATHELIVAALDPAERRWLDAPVRGMLPLEFAAQFIAQTDDWAIARCERSVRLIVEGRLSPDGTARLQWVRDWGDNMMRRDFSATSH